MREPLDIATVARGTKDSQHGSHAARPDPFWVRAAWLLPLLCFAAVLVAPREPVTWAVPWAAEFGVEFALNVDGLSRLLLLLVTGVGVAVFYYAPGYLHGQPHVGRLMGLLTAFFIAMAGSVAADDLLLLFLFWEATSVLSFLLVGFDHEKKASRESALHALLVTAGGGVLMLAGVILILQAAPDLRVSDLARLDPTVLADTRFQAGVALVVVSAMTKSAQFPFHFWLPDAMAAPTPVSAYLHSATMVNLGVYVLARFDGAMGAVTWWSSGLTAIGSLTAVWGALQSLRERDLKRILAWSTVSALGTLTLLIGLPNELGALAFVAFLLAHALYKAPLFFVAGNVDHAVGTRIIDNLCGLRRVLPWTAVAAVLAAVSMAGLPSTVGFIAKDTIKLAKELSDAAWFVGLAGLFVSAVSVAAASVIAGRVFFGPRHSPATKRGHESPRLLLPPMGLAAAGIGVGLFPGFVEPILLDAARMIAPSLESSAADLNTEWFVRAETWLLVLGLACAVYAGWDRLHRFLDSLSFLDAIGPGSAYQIALTLLRWTAGVVTRRLQSGRVTQYLLIATGAVVLTLAPWTFTLDWRWPQSQASSGALGIAVGCAAAIAGAALALRQGDTLQRLLGLGAVGFGSAVVFLFSGAPDLALTQLLVETVFVVVAAVTLYGYRELAHTPSNVALRVSIAAAFGLLLAGAAYALAALPPHDAMSRYFLENSVPLAHGRNVVNVIIVDFRALDTLGEISVVMLAAMAAWPLLRRVQATRPILPGERSIVLEKSIALLYWILLAAAVWLLLRGHNAPGGGFIAALVAVAATSAYAFAFGTGAARRRLPLRPLRLATVGLGFAAASGLPGVALGDPFLTHLWGEVGVAGASLKISTVLLFDLGVMLCVWGSLSGFCLRLLEMRR